MDGTSLPDELDICRTVISRLLEKRGWRLVGIEAQALAQSTLDDLRSQGDALEPAAIERCAARQYVIAFYRACLAGGTVSQAQAFQYLGERLARIALHKTGDEDWAVDCAQRALKIVYEKLNQCRDARCFFSWTRTIVLNEIRQDLRRAPELSLDELSQEREPNQPDGLEWSACQTPQDALAEVEDDLSAKQMVAQVHQILGDSKEWRVVCEFYLKGRSYLEIAASLQTSLNNVYLLMHRAIRKLRSDERLRRELPAWAGRGAERASRRQTPGALPTACQVGLMQNEGQVPAGVHLAG